MNLAMVQSAQNLGQEVQFFRKFQDQSQPPLPKNVPWISKVPQESKNNPATGKIHIYTCTKVSNCPTYMKTPLPQTPYKVL
jgi:hypothetical protein